MVDGYPAGAWDGDCEIQLVIGAEMAHAQRLHDAFERAFPAGGSTPPMHRLARLRHQPKADELYPSLFAAEDRREWLLPLVQRFEWHRAHGDPDAPWLTHLTAMIRVALLTVRQVSEEEFLALAAPAEALVERRCGGYLERMARYTRQLERAAPLSRPVVDAVRRLLSLCNHPHANTDRIEIFSWPYFRSETGFDESDRCWSARVRRDLAGMEPKPRALWLRAFDAESHSVRAGAGMPSMGCLAAVERLGKPELERGLRRWIGMLFNDCGPVLSPVGTIVFRHVIGLCDLLGGRAGDEALFEIARAPWRPAEEHRWLDTYLWALGRRPNDRAFACLESLMRNAATSTEAVRQRYEPMLTVFGAGALPASAAGVDGFVLNQHPALEVQETRIHQLRPMAADVAVRAPCQDVGTVRQLVTRLASVEKLPLEALLEAIRAGRGNLKIFDLCRQHVAQHGWNAQLVEAMRAWTPALGSGATDNHYRALVEWFLWFEDVSPIDRDACWSHRVKQDLRATEAGELSTWRALLDNNTFIITAKPPKRWLKAAEPAFQRVGREAFRSKFVAWFSPFGKSEPLRLTVTGRNVLRLLMWYALVAQDPEVDEAMAGFALAKWKNKESAKRAPQAEMAFSYVLSERAPEKAITILEQLVVSGQAFEGSKTQRIYEELCARSNRKPVTAIPKAPQVSKKEDGLGAMLDALMAKAKLT